MVVRRRPEEEVEGGPPEKEAREWGSEEETKRRGLEEGPENGGTEAQVNDTEKEEDLHEDFDTRACAEQTEETAKPEQVSWA